MKHPRGETGNAVGGPVRHVPPFCGMTKESDNGCDRTGIAAAGRVCGDA